MMEPYLSDPDFTLYVGDVRDVLRELPAASVDCVVTSPPYWGLRDYGTGSWEGGDPACDHIVPLGDGGSDEAGGYSRPFRTGKQYTHQQVTGLVCRCGARRTDRQIGLEATPQEFVATMVEVFREVRRVLAPHGTVWLNLGDSYARREAQHGFSPRIEQGNGEGRFSIPSQERIAARQQGERRKPHDIGLKDKDLVGIPWRTAFALQNDGWVLRSDVIWHKVNPMPESVTDRPTKSHEYVFLLSKSEWKGIENPLRLDPVDAAWLAAMMDGEGTICVNTRKDRQYEPTYSAALRCYNTNRALIERVAELAGCGTITLKTNSGLDGTRECWQWQCGGRTAVAVLDAIEPYLIAKRQQAHLLLELQGMRRHHGAQAGFGKGMKPRPAAVTRRQEEIARGCSELNLTGTTDVDVFPWKRGYWKPLPYHFDQEAVREPAEWNRWGDQTNKKHEGSGSAAGWISTKTREELNANRRSYPAGQTGGNTLDGHTKGGSGGMPVNPAGRNIRSVWSIATQPYADAHFATFPEELPRRAILAGCPEWVCRVCGKPRERIVERGESDYARLHEASGRMDDGYRAAAHTITERGTVPSLKAAEVTTVGWSDCGHNDYRPGVVLDPFIGSGTTAYVARNHGRHAVGVELNPEYAALIGKRTQQQSLLS